jgi:hypothetical protein
MGGSLSLPGICLTTGLITKDLTIKILPCLLVSYFLIHSQQIISVSFIEIYRVEKKIISLFLNNGTAEKSPILAWKGGQNLKTLFKTQRVKLIFFKVFSISKLKIALKTNPQPK